jgi:glutathione S-transferase
MAIGRSVYADTRLILQKLEQLYPPSSAHPGLTPTTPEGKALAYLIDKWVTDGGIFSRCALLIPPEGPVMSNPAFLKDREQMSGRSWDPQALKRARPESLVEIREAHRFLEDLLSDGREFLLGGKEISMVDLEAVWPFHWLTTMPGAVPEEVAGPKSFPKAFAWLRRCEALWVAAGKKNPQPTKYKGPEATSRIVAAGYPQAVEVDSADPTGLKKGQEVIVHPLDSGMFNKDKGKLVGLNGSEIVLEVGGEAGSVRLHFPRHGFRIMPAEAGKL